MTRVAAIATITLLAATGAAIADEAAVQALEQKCEAAREVRLKPLREAEIARCKAEKRNDAAECERYWADYGDAIRRPNGTMQPRMFHDLPECVAADEARRKLNLGN
jgi:hypothetical protein